MYRKKDRMSQREAKIVSLEDLVPQNHLLRKIDEVIDFDFIYDEVKWMYSEIEWGKPGPFPMFPCGQLFEVHASESKRRLLPEPYTVNVAVTWEEGYCSYPGRSARHAPDKRV